MAGSVLAEELEALQSIYTGEEVTVLQEREEGGTIIMYKYNSSIELSLKLDASYPASLPSFTVPPHLKNLGILAHLVTVATPLVGTPMLYAIIDAAKDWLDGHALSLAPPTGGGGSKSPSPGPEAAASVSVCKFYLQGKCRFGDKCKNSHPGAKTQTGSQTKQTGSHTTGTQSQTKTKGSKSEASATSNGGGSGSPSKKQDRDDDDDNDESPSKKDKMRTATEVISRILWDPDLPSEEFSVGYLDRFIGIIEKPFKEFSWEDIASVGANVLAVPKHRIQYFKYKDVIVWDKRNQTDNFFGSRGGMTIQEVISKNQSATASPQASSDDQQALSLLEAESEYPPESKTDGAPRYHSDVNRPTHFVCLHVNDEGVVEEIKKVVSHVTHLNPQLREGLINTPALHVTLCMVRLTTEEQIEKAKSVLQSVKLQFTSLLPSCMQLSFTGVDNFRERLIYVKVKEEPALGKFVSHLIEQFQGAGLKTPGNHEEYTPHITIVKLSRPMQRELNTDVINPACYQPYLNVSLGQQLVTGVHLCSMHAPAQEDGFYLRYSTLTNSLLGLPQSFITLVENQFGLLADLGYLSQSDREALLSDLSSTVENQNEERFDEIIEELTRLNKEAMSFESLHPLQPCVVILRGLPGSGKSFLASHCQEVLKDTTKTAILSADDYFTSRGRGEEGGRADYVFNPANAYKAHQHVLTQFLSSLANGVKLVIIDNTNTQLWEYRIYTHICDILGYPYHILEIPFLLSSNLAELYRLRNIHSIQPAAIAKMCQRWEEDERRVLVPPQLVYPRSSPSSSSYKGTPTYSLLSLCDAQSSSSLSDLINSDSRVVPVYTGLFLSIESQWELLKTYRPTHSDIFASHVTLHFKPTPHQLAELPLGKRVQVQVVGESDNGRVQAAVVELPSHVTSENKSPHVTISTVPGLPPKLANAMLQSKLIKQNQVIYLEGILGLVVRHATPEEREGKDTLDDSLSSLSFHTITSQNDLKSIAPKLLYTTTEASDPAPSLPYKETTGILTGEQEITQLFVFDFDGTLFIPPGNYQGRREYERLTGKKWHRKGWLTHADSLLPPLHVPPGPALSEYRSHDNRAGSYTVVLTGRADSVRPGLVYVLEKAQLYPQRIICKPNDTGETTSAYKMRKVKELLEEFPNVTLVKFWDDISENLSAIQRLSSTQKSKGFSRQVQFEVIDATQMSTIHGAIRSPRKPLPHPVTQFGSHVQAHLTLYGLLPSLDHKSAVQEGLLFVSTQFAKLIGYRGNPLNLSYEFGSSPLNRIGDVDVCLLAPPSHTHIEWLTLLAKELETCGIKHTHIGHSARCPRLKILLQFSHTPSIEFDIVIALVHKEEFFKGAEGRMSASKVAETRDASDGVSKVAISGALFMERIESVAKKNGISLETIGGLVELTLQLLMAKREKGNAYHCIRSFHIVKLLIDYLDTATNPHSPSSSHHDELFKSFISHASEMTFDNWKNLLDEFVPEEYIPRLMSIFKEASTLLSVDTLSSYEELLSRSVFPPEEYTPVEIRLSGNDSLKKWRARMIIEARLPTYIRQLLSRGINVVSNGNKNNDRLCFAVPQLPSSKETLQQVLRPFWSEMADLKKEDGLSIHLTLGLPTDIQSHVTTTTDARARGVLESVRSFVSSEQRELHLPSSLTAHTRLLVHETAETLGLAHSSIGKGNNRHIVLKKL